MSVFKDVGHLLRFAGLFVLAFRVFLVIRGYVVPKSFGQYGHYRGAAIGEIAARPVKFAGHQLLPSVALTLLPLGILWILVKLLPPWPDEQAPEGVAAD